MVAQPSFQKVSRKPASATLSPNHWWKASWWRVPIDGVDDAPLPNVILVCISSANPTLGRATMTPAVVNGYGPAKFFWNSIMLSSWSMLTLMAALRAAVSPDASAW